MSRINVYLDLWEDLRTIGEKTIQVIDNAMGWDFRINPKEYSVYETFRHTVQAIFEDAGNWFLGDSTRFTPSNDQKADLTKAINRMKQAIANFQDHDLTREFTFQWGEKTTIGGAILQNLFHTIGHFAQIRNWVGLYQRQRKKQAEKTYL